MNIQSENTLRPEPVFFALEMLANGQGFVSGRLMPRGYQKGQFHGAVPFGWLHEVMVGAISYKKGTVIFLIRTDKNTYGEYIN